METPLTPIVEKALNLAGHLFVWYVRILVAAAIIGAVAAVLMIVTSS